MLNTPTPPSHWFRLWGAICGAFLVFLVMGVAGVLVYRGSQGFLVGAVPGAIVGFVIGYTIDQLFGTSPWGMIVFLLLGFAAGVLNILRSAGRAADPFSGGTSGKTDDK